MKKYTLVIEDSGDGVKHTRTIEGFNKVEILGLLNIEVQEVYRQLGKLKRTNKILKK